MTRKAAGPQPHWNPARKMKMRSLLLKMTAASLITASVPAAQAATAGPASFNVTVNLTSACQITAGPADVAFTYTSFQGGAATATGGGFSVKCTNTLPYTMALDS